MNNVPSDDVLESLYRLRIRESDQLKTVLEMYDMEIRQKISMPNYQKFPNDGGKSRQEQWSRVTGDYVALREEKEFAVSGKKKASVQGETNAVSGTRVTFVQNRH